LAQYAEHNAWWLETLASFDVARAYIEPSGAPPRRSFPGHGV